MENERGFKGVWIPREIWLSKELTLREKVMIVEIDSLETEDNGCYASNSYFSEFFNISNISILSPQSIGRCNPLINVLI